MSEDTISRQAAIRWVKTECNPYGKPTLDFESGKKVIEHLKQMPSAEADSKELSGTHKALDTISRQDAIRIVDGIDTWQAGWRGDAIESMKALPSAQPETHEERTETHACDSISRRKAFEYFVTLWECIGTIMDRDEWEDVCMTTANEIPSAQPERLTDDDFETIRIHLNAYKEKLCNQQRWEEADEYQRIIDRFMAFASPQQEIIRCKDCKHHHRDNSGAYYCGRKDYGYGWGLNDFCSDAERRTDD